MAVNIDYLLQKGLSYYEFTLLQLIAQNTESKMYEEIILHMQDENLKRLLALDLLRLLPLKKKSDHEYTRLRLSKKGKEVFKNAQIVDYTEEDEKLLDYLKALYKKIDKPLGNDVKIKKLLAWFRVETHYSRKLIYIAIKYFLSKLEEESKLKYVPSLENLLWKSANVFSSKWSLSESKLYQFIQENKKELNGYREDKQ